MVELEVATLWSRPYYEAGLEIPGTLRAGRESGFATRCVSFRLNIIKCCHGVFAGGERVAEFYTKMIPVWLAGRHEQ